MIRSIIQSSSKSNSIKTRRSNTNSTTKNVKTSYYVLQCNNNNKSTTIRHTTTVTLLSNNETYISKNRKYVSNYTLPNNIITKKDRISLLNIREYSSKANTNTKTIKIKQPKAVEVEEIYKSLTPIEHILHRPGMYIGQKQSYIEENIYKLNINSNKYEFIKEYKIETPSLLKIFDEILVNASDHRMKYPKYCNKIEINVDKKNGIISIKNNGKGIPIFIHEKEGIYIPELLFGRLLTGSNFNDELKNRITAGTHGYGAKLTNIFSKSFQVETIDTIRKLKYR